MTKCKAPVISRAIKTGTKVSCVNLKGNTYEKQKRGEYLKRSRIVKKSKTPHRLNRKRRTRNRLLINSSSDHPKVRKTIQSNQTVENSPTENVDEKSNLDNHLSRLAQNGEIASMLRLPNVKTSNNMAVIYVNYVKKLQEFAKLTLFDHIKVLKTNFFTLTFPDGSVLVIELSLYLNGFGISEGKNVSVSIRGQNDMTNPSETDPCDKPTMKTQDSPSYVVSVFLQHPMSVSSSYRRSFKVCIRDIHCKSKGLLDFITLDKFEEYIDATGGVKLGLCVQK